jgi:hypothetical protein
MSWVGFEPTILAFERAKAVHVLDGVATVIGKCEDLELQRMKEDLLSHLSLVRALPLKAILTSHNPTRLHISKPSNPHFSIFSPAQEQNIVTRRLKVGFGDSTGTQRSPKMRDA